MVNELTETKLGNALLETAFVNQVAVLAATGMAPKEIAKQISQESGIEVKHQKVAKVLATEECRAVVESITAQALTEAKITLKRQMANLVNKAVQVVEHHLKKNNLNAVPLVFKALGVEQEDSSTGDTVINIKMVDTNTPKDVIEVIEE